MKRFEEKRKCSKVFVLAGEASGDRIGADLMAGLRRKLPDAQISGVGGDAMRGEGLASLFPMEDLAVMGYRDVFLRLPLLLWRARQVIGHIMANRPDVVVLIDAQVFSKVVARALRKRGYGGKIVLYVAPAVWAWGAQRARKLAELFDEVLSVLPFEPAAMLALGGPRTAYVGHPAVANHPMRQHQPERGPFVMLPGSRRSEIAKHGPLFADIAPRLAGHPAVSQIVLFSTRAQSDYLRTAVSKWPVPVSVVEDAAQRREILDKAVAAVAVSGTVTLELALSGVPHVLTYIAEPMQVRMFEKATTRYIGLPNIIADREVISEVLFAGKGDPDALWTAVGTLLDHPEKRQEQAERFRLIRELMEKGTPEAPLQNAAERIISLLATD